MMTMKKKRITIQELMAKGQVIAPCVWDCFSASAAKYSGYEALLLSGAAVSWAYCGMPDIGLCTMEELVNICDHIADAYNMPIIVDADEGYGESPVNTYRTCQRLAKAGAAAITIDDGTGIRGTERVVYRNGYKTGIVDRETYYARIRAALAALEGTDCMLVARTISKGAYGIDEAIERVGTAIEMGAGMPLIIGMRGIQAQIINLFRKLQQELGLTYIFVAHDLAVVHHIADTIAVMYLGHIVEIMDAHEIYGNPMHPYTKALISAVPITDYYEEQSRKRLILPGEVPSPIDAPSGCPFHPRCSYASDICKAENPVLVERGKGHHVACHCIGR